MVSKSHQSEELTPFYTENWQLLLIRQSQWTSIWSSSEIIRSFVSILKKMQSVEMGKFNVDLISMLIHAILHILGRTSHVNATMCQDATSEAVQCKTASTNFVLICCMYKQDSATPQAWNIRIACGILTLSSMNYSKCTTKSNKICASW